MGSNTEETQEFGLLGVSGHLEWQQGDSSRNVAINLLLHQPRNF